MSPNFIEADEECRIVGWSSPKTINSSTMDIVEMKMKILNHSNCSKRFTNIEKITEDFQMCGEGETTEERTHLVIDLIDIIKFILFCLCKLSEK